MGQWKEEVIIQVLEEQALNSIVTTARPPKNDPLIHDRLIWEKSKKWAYTTVEGYENLSRQRIIKPVYS